MEKIVIDTSVAVKWFVNEPKSQQAVTILSHHTQKKILIVVPAILRLELINGLFFSYHFGSSQLSESLISLESLELQFFSTRDIDLNNVTALMEKFTIASYDACFLSLAKGLNCPLITNDRRHHLRKMYRKIEYL